VRSPEYVCQPFDMDRMRDAIAVSGNHIFIEDYTQHTVVCDMGPGPHTKPHMN
jgi:hypothetical protein